MAKKKEVLTAAQIREQQRKNNLLNLKFDDDKKVHTAAEIRQAAIQQGLIAPKPIQKRAELTQSAPQPVTFTSAAAASDARKGGGAFDLANQVARTNTETMPRIAKNTQLARTIASRYGEGTSYEDVQSDLDRLQKARAGAQRRGRDTTAYDIALGMVNDYAKNGGLARDASVEDIQKQLDKPLKTMDDINLDDPDVVSSYLSHDRNAVQFFNDYRIGKLAHTEDNVERYNNLLNTIEAKVNNANNANTRYAEGTKVALTDSDGNKVNYSDLLRHKVAQNRISDLSIDPDKAKSELERISNGNRNLVDAAPTSGEQLKAAGWDVSGDSVAIPVEAYQDEINNNAAVFSPIVKDESGNVVRILSPQELEEYAKDVLNGGADKLGLKATDTYKGMYAASLAQENASRIRRLGERYYNNTNFDRLLLPDEARKRKFFAGVDYSRSVVPDEARKKKLREKGVDYDEYSAYENLLNAQQSNREQVKAYSDWSTQNIGTGALATAANILMSPIQAVEYLQNLGESLIGHIEAGTNELSAHNLPNIYNDTATSLSEESTGAITEAIRSGIRGNGDNAFINFVADAAANTYGGVTSGIQSALTYGTLSLVLPPEVASGIALGTMSAQAANGAYHDVIKNGGTVGQAITYSAAAGLNEYLGEKLSLDNLINITATAGKQTAKEILLSVLGQGIIEGTEEVTTEALNEFADRLINADKSEYERAKKNYIANGYSEEEAASKASADFIARVGWAAYGGFVGGLLPGAGKVATNTIKNNIYERQVGRAVTSAGNTQALIDLAYQSADAKIRQSGQELETLNRSTGNVVRDRIRESRTQKRAGQLYTELQKNNIEQFKSAEQSVRLEAIENLYAEQIDDKERKDPTVSKVAKLIDKAVTGQTLTEREQRTVSSPSAQAVINKIKEDTDLIESQTKQAKAKALGDYAKAQKLVMPKETETINDDDVDTDDFIISKKDDGKVYKDNEVVETGAITDISGDDIKVETGNGNTDSVKSLSMPTEQAVLYQSLMDVQNETGIELSPAIANDIVSLAQSADNDLSLSQSVRAATQALVKGYTNNSNEYSSDSYASKLSDSTRQKFYDLGRELATAQTAEQQQRVLDRVSNQDNQREGTVTYEDDIDHNKLDSRRKASADFVEAYAKVNGTDVVFFASKPDGKGRRSSKYVTENRLTKDGEQAPNGFWHDGKMYIDINAGMNGEGLVLFTMSHEIVHMIREGSPEDYKALADFLISKYAEKGIDVDDLVRLKQEEYGAPKYLAMKEMGKSTNLTYDEALEEVIADSCESFLLDLADAKRGAEISRQLKKDNPTLWERIKDAIYNILQRVRNAYRLAKPQSREAQIIARMKDIIEPAYEIYVRGYTNAARNLRNMEGGLNSSSIKFEKRLDEEIKRELSDVDTKFSIRKEDPPVNTIIGYKVFRIKDGKLYPPMVANPGGEDTPVGVWLNADVGERAPDSKTGRAQVKGKGGMSLAFRPGWHLGDIPRASQFDRKNPETGAKDMFPSDFVWAECDCAADVDYQDEAMSYGYTDNGKFRHAYAGLPRVPENGYYKYRTNPRPDTVPWIITGAIKVNRILSDAEVSEILEKNGVKPPVRQGGNKTLEELGLNNKHIKRQSRTDSEYLSAVERGDMETAQRMVDEAAKAAGYDMHLYHGAKSGGGFTVFKDWQYFTADKKYAEKYTQRNTESNSLYEVFAKSDRMFDTRNADDQAVFAQYRSEYGMSELQESGLPDWTDGYDLSKIIEENNLDYDGIILDEGVQYYPDAEEYDDRYRRVLSYVVRKSNQIKSADPVTYDDNGNVIPLSERFNPENKDIRYQSRIDTPEFKRWFGNSKVVDKNGEPLVVYHGTSRADRVGNVFLPERATSGPMAYFTDSKDIANNYARDKADTSLAYDNEYDSYYTQFRVNRNGKNISVTDLWKSLPYTEKQRMKERAKHITFDDEAENIIYDKNAQYGVGAFDNYTLNMHNGNVIETLVDNWLDDGNLFGEEERFIEVLDLLGVDGVQYMNPLYREEKVYETYLSIQNPFDTSKADESFISGLEEWWSEQDEDEYYKESAQADMWDKNSMTVEDFIGRLEDDLENGTSRSWVTIPDAVTAYLKAEGYDGIKDKGGKFTNDTHTVWIPFESTQVKSATDNIGTFDRNNPDIRYQQRSEGYDFSDFGFDLIEDDGSIENSFAREYSKHSEDIGEVLKNIAAIDIAPSKAEGIIRRVVRNSLGGIDSETVKTLSTELQYAMEFADRRDDYDQLSNEMISAVRKAINNATVMDERAEANYKDLLGAFKGKRFYLTDEQLADLQEHDMTLNDYRKRMFGKINIVSRENLEKSINGSYKNAQELSLEGLYDVLEVPEEYLSYSRDQWDEYGYHAPIILQEAFDTLKDRRTAAISDMANESELDDLAVDLTAKITGAIVQEKYNSRQNPYISKLVKDLRAKRTEAVKKQKEKNRKKLAELKQKERERADKREQDLKEKYQEQRANARESRQRTEFRNKIRKLTESLRKRLTNPKGQQYVPRDLIAQTIDVLNAIDLDTGRSTRLSEKLALVRIEYDKLQKEAEAYAMYDPVISQALLNVTEDIKGVNIMDMSLRQLKNVYDVIRAMDYVVRESVKMTDTKFKQDAHQLGRNWIAEIRAVPKEHSGAVSGWIQTMLSPERFFDRIAGFKKNSTSLQLYDMLNAGQLRMTQLEMELTQIFDALIKDSKQLKSLYDTKHLVDIGLEDENGNKVEITRGMMISLYMHLLNEDNTRHVMGGGLTVPNMTDYYKGDIKKAYGKGMQRVRVGALDYSRYAEGIKSVIENELTDYEIAWIEAAHDFFDVASRKALNDTTMKLYGFKRANVDNYFPIHTDSNYRAASFEAIQRDMSLENSGFMKERVKASNPILLEDIVDVVNHQIAQVSKYCGMTLPIKNFQKVYGTTTRDFESSVQEVLNKKFSGTKNNTGATKYIDNYITDLTTGRSTDEGPIAKRLGRMRGFLAQSTLTLNPRVAIAQAASYPTAAAEIGWKPLMKALKNGGKNNRVFSRADQELIAEISPYLWKRTQGYSNVEIGDINELRKQKHKVQGKVKKAMSWIEFFDGMTVGRLFYACQYYVDEQFPELKRGTEEYNKKLADVYNKVIERTQPNYTVSQRPDILRNPNALVKSLTMFMTQRLQNFNIVYSAAGKYNKYLKDYKAGINDVTAEDVKAAKVGLRRAIVSQTVSAATIVGMKLLADALLHSMTGYRDDDDELTAQSVSLKLLNNFADTIFGSVLFGSELYSLISSLVTGERYYGISLSGIDSLSDALDSVTKLRKGVDFDSINGVAKSICQLLGIPLANAEKIASGIYNHAVDISEGEFMSFESGVDRTRKQDIHRIELAYNSGDKEKANKIKDELLKSQTDKGKTEKEALSWLRSGFTTAYKQQYIEAVKNNDSEKIKNIRELLYYTGVYGTLAEQDKAMQKWLKNEE